MQLHQTSFLCGGWQGWLGIPGHVHDQCMVAYLFILLLGPQVEMQSQRGSSQEGEVFILPTIRINHGQYRGKLAYSEVLKAICAGFTKNNEPDVCLRVAEDDCREGSVGDRECKARYVDRLHAPPQTCWLRSYGPLHPISGFCFPHTRASIVSSSNDTCLAAD